MDFSCFVKVYIYEYKLFLKYLSQVQIIRNEKNKPVLLNKNCIQ